MNCCFFDQQPANTNCMCLAKTKIEKLGGVTVPFPLIWNCPKSYWRKPLWLFSQFTFKDFNTNNFFNLTLLTPSLPSSSKHEVWQCKYSFQGKIKSKIYLTRPLEQYFNVPLLKYANADLKIYRYLCLHIKIICRRFCIITAFNFWVMRTRDIWNVCLQTYKNNRMLKSSLLFKKNTNFTGK